MGTDEFLNLASSEVRKYVNKHYPKTEVDVFDVYTVWSCKTLQNNKALLSTTLSDGMYFEATYNGNKREMYLDVYKKKRMCALNYKYCCERTYAPLIFI